MHTLVEVPVGTNGGTHVPAFLAKLWKIVDDPSTNDLICWSEMGNSFIIKNQAKFARDLLPLYYKHNNMASFVRQLNMYGFHKVVSVEQGGLRVDKDEMEFAHPFFLKGQEASLELIKRKIPASKHEESRVRPDSLNKVLLDVRQMKGRQETMDNKLVTMKRENEALWRELASLRQKHAKQTQIVSKLLQFLVGMMSQQTPRLAFKRRMPLMLNDKEGIKQKFARTETTEISGPVIRDVTELLESDDSAEGNQEFTVTSDGSSFNVPSNIPYTETVGSPDSPELLFSVDPTTINPAVSVPGVAQMQQNVGQTKQVKAKPKAIKRNANTVSLASVKSEPSTGFPISSNVSSQNIIQAQPIQVAGLSSAPLAQNNVPTTLYFTGPGMSEPVQVVLSIPDHTATSSSAPSTSNVAHVSAPNIVPIPSTSTTNISPGKSLNVPQSSSQNTSVGKTAALMDLVGRNHAINPRILVKPNAGVAPEDLGGHLEDVEVELNNLRDLFKSDGYSMDNDTLIGVSTSRPFNLAAIDPETYAQLFNGAVPIDNSENQGDMNQQLQLAAAVAAAGAEGGLQGQELVAYNPSLFELAEDDANFFDESSNIFLDDELESMLTTDRDSLKRPEGQNRGVGHLSFSEVNLNNSLDSGLNTPIVCEPASIPGTSAGASKRKRK